MGLYPLPSCLFIRGLSHLPCSMVDFLGAWSNSFLIAFFVMNSGLLLTGFLIFDAGLLGCVLIWGCFCLWHCVLCSMGYYLWNDYVVYIEGLELQSTSVFGLGLWWLLLHFWLLVLAFDHCSENLLPSNWMIFFTLCWDVRGKGGSHRFDTSIKLLTLLLQLNCFGLVSSFNSGTLKSTNCSSWFVLGYEHPSLTMSCGTECVLGCIVSGFYCVSKLCATFLGYMGKIWCICENWFGVTFKLNSLSNSSLEFVVSFKCFAPCLYNLIFFSSNALFFIGEMVGTRSMVSSRWLKDIIILRWRTLLLFRYDLDFVSFSYREATSAISGS